MSSTTWIVLIFLSHKVKRLKRSGAYTVGTLPSFLCMVSIMFTYPPLWLPPLTGVLFFPTAWPTALIWGRFSSYWATILPKCADSLESWEVTPRPPPATVGGRTLEAQLSDCLRLEQILRCHLSFWIPAGSGWSHLCRTFLDPVSPLFLLPLSPLLLLRLP